MKLEKMKMIRLYPNEEFKEITIEDKLRLRYAVSNKGRLISFVDDMRFARELRGGMTDGYRLFKYKQYNEGVVKNKHLFIYKLVAEYFIPKTSEDQVHILHLDRKRDNDDYRNLKWATAEEMAQHTRESPYVKQARLNLVKHNLESNGSKLTITKVMLIKKILARPGQTTRLKMIAKQFGVSEMQIRRIKSGENWSQVKI
ncbi:hypothetical protein HNQ02_002667 [Flavobacterium sp. 7E]|uniref:phage terminase small subunit-related protein n=1 Tax=unclassified Flavobacterium TaxID=196869 RepID=UPI001A04F3B9|nr:MULTISPECIES: phage terminase small subunit-related protein [unclassified Flavobacterium]MBE0390306.1 hypothetical protein [Flavobacterium sp. PL002]NRS89735.1 hypothetical protein [Flavobacterium sp. 7E]NRT16198.1 hypothetical protein [Flavobacterium sp. 28A]